MLLDFFLSYKIYIKCQDNFNSVIKKGSIRFMKIIYNFEDDLFSW